MAVRVPPRTRTRTRPERKTTTGGAKGGEWRLESVESPSAGTGLSVDVTPAREKRQGTLGESARGTRGPLLGLGSVQEALRIPPSPGLESPHLQSFAARHGAAEPSAEALQELLTERFKPAFF
jgi:hypothetical protein